MQAGFGALPPPAVNVAQMIARSVFPPMPAAAVIPVCVEDTARSSAPVCAEATDVTRDADDPPMSPAVHVCPFWAIRPQLMTSCVLVVVNVPEVTLAPALVVPVAVASSGSADPVAEYSIGMMTT